MSKLSEALAAYERSLVLGGDAAAKNGRADALKALGRLDEALLAYESARPFFAAASPPSTSERS